MRTCACGARLETREQLRRGACSTDCQRAHTFIGRDHRSQPAPSFTLARGVTFNRKHGTDRKASNE